MEPFTADKSFYDIAATDLKELWDSDLDPNGNELRGCDEDWSEMVAVKPEVILHDRLLHDAVLPIKSEHSYCTSSSKTDTEEEDELEIELFPLSPMSSVSHQSLPPRKNTAPLSVVVVKTEPLSETESQASSCPSSPIARNSLIYEDTRYDVKPNFLHVSGQSLLKQTVVITTKNPLMQKKHLLMHTAKLEPAHIGLPPTPPSSTCSDNEGNLSPIHPSSPSRRPFASTSRQPIQTNLISSQPKGSTGILFLTEEEKRTLLAEGYPIPIRLPLTKAEEKSLKKIRRKIKNKISAQESRRKKKEYMDALERRVQLLSSENSLFRKKITALENANTNLMSQLDKLQMIIESSENGVISNHKYK